MVCIQRPAAKRTLSLWVLHSHQDSPLAPGFGCKEVGDFLSAICACEQKSCCFFFLTGFQKGLEFCVYIHTLALTITLLWKWVHCALTSHVKVDVAVLIFFHLM